MDPITTTYAALKVGETAGDIYGSLNREIKSYKYGKIKIQFFGIIDFYSSVSLESLETAIRNQLNLKNASKKNGNEYLIENKLTLTQYFIDPVFVEEIDGDLFIADDLDSELDGSNSSRLYVKRITFWAIPERLNKEPILQAGTVFASFIEGIESELQPAKTFIITKVIFPSDKKFAKFQERISSEMKKQNLVPEKYLLWSGKEIKVTVKGFSEVGRILSLVDQLITKINPFGNVRE